MPTTQFIVSLRPSRSPHQLQEFLDRSSSCGIAVMQVIESHESPSRVVVRGSALDVHALVRDLGGDLAVEEDAPLNLI